jgi:translation initiation factor eIF-2B subunit gamma
MLHPFQAIILAGAGGKHLFPLNSAGLPKVLLPVANRPLLTFPLRTLEEAGITDVLVVCEGDAAAAAVKSWFNQQHKSGISIEVVKVAEELPSVSALRQVMDKIKTENCVVLSGDVVTEVPLRAQLLQHQLRGATVTALFGRRKTSPAADTQPGKPPRNVDYVGLAENNRLAYYAHSVDAVKEVALPQAALQRFPSLSLTTKLVDMQVYVFQTAALREVLQEHPELEKLEDHLLPYLARRQAPVGSGSKSSLKEGEAGGVEAMASRSGSGGGTNDEGASVNDNDNGGTQKSEWMCTAYVAPEGSYCQRANTLQGYADVNREAVTPELALKLIRETPHARGENFLAPGVTLGTKATVGGACMVGSESILGDKCSVKRSVIGRGCSLGGGVKIINSVLMDNVQVGANCIIQNSILCKGCVLQAGAQVKDCQVGPGYVVKAGSDHKAEVLALEAKKN